MMKTMYPGDDLHLGQDALDLEHRGQINHLLAVETELQGAAGKAQLRTLLDRLIEFTNIHFMSEQVLMRERAYPGLLVHEAEHDQLMDQMRDFQKRIESDERTLTAADLSTLRSWVLQHIRTKDTALAQFLKVSA
jgi:hemerythrin